MYIYLGRTLRWAVGGQEGEQVPGSGPGRFQVQLRREDRTVRCVLPGFYGAGV